MEEIEGNYRKLKEITIKASGSRVLGLGGGGEERGVKEARDPRPETLKLF